MSRAPKHNFTYKGRTMGGRELCGILGMTNPTLYGIANKIKSDVGEEILAYQQAHPPGTDARMMEFDGKMVPAADVAKIFELTKQAFYTRLDKYGEDCCLTYYPGRIPARLQNKRPKPKTDAPENKGNAEWRALSDKVPRTSELELTEPGTWERRWL